jgi:hypothetical protein
MPTGKPRLNSQRIRKMVTICLSNQEDKALDILKKELGVDRGRIIGKLISEKIEAMGITTTKSTPKREDKNV